MGTYIAATRVGGVSHDGLQAGAISRSTRTSWGQFRSSPFIASFRFINPCAWTSVFKLSVIVFETSGSPIYVMGCLGLCWSEWVAVTRSHSRPESLHYLLSSFPVPCIPKLAPSFTAGYGCHLSGCDPPLASQASITTSLSTKFSTVLVSRPFCPPLSSWVSARPHQPDRPQQYSPIAAAAPRSRHASVFKCIVCLLLIIICFPVFFFFLEGWQELWATIWFSCFFITNIIRLLHKCYKSSPILTTRTKENKFRTKK